MPPQPRRRRHPRQERSRELVRCVREAGRQLVEQVGVEGLTVQAIADRAGVSVGSLYQYFESKEELVRTVLSDVVDERISGGRSLSQALLALPAPERLRAGIEFAIAHHLRMLEVGSDYYREHHAEFRTGTRLAVSPDARGAKAFAQQLLDLAQQDSSDPAVLRHAAFLLGRGLPAMLRAAVEDDPQLLEDPSFVDELTLLFSAYLDAPRT